jgi:hypothetical protein
MTAFDLRFRRIRQVGPVAFAGMDHQHVDGARRREHRLAGRDRAREQRDIVAERLAEAARLEEIALHVDDDQRGAGQIERHCLGLGLDRGAHACLPIP